MARTPKTNAARLLDAAGITYEVRRYDLTMDEFSAEAVAERIGLPGNVVFKTLVATIDGTDHCFAVVPGDAELDLKALAAAAGGRKAALAPVADVPRLTGYVRGAVTVLGAKRTLPVFVDQSAHDVDTLAVSGGAKGVQLVLAAGDYLAVTEARLARIARESGAST